MADKPKHVVEGEGDLAVATEKKTERVRRYMVIFHNDDYTTKWFVVMVLEQLFHMSEAKAAAFMMGVHEQGYGVALVTTKDVAESKVAQVHDVAREYGMPLRLTAEPEE